MRAHKKKVLPGFEPGLQDSKSRVITNYTIEPLLTEVRIKNKYTQCISPAGFEPAILRFVVSRLIHWATGTFLVVCVCVCVLLIIYSEQK